MAYSLIIITTEDGVANPIFQQLVDANILKKLPLIHYLGRRDRLHVLLSCSEVLIRFSKAPSSSSLAISPQGSEVVTHSLAILKNYCDSRDAETIHLFGNIAAFLANLLADCFRLSPETDGQQEVPSLAEEDRKVLLSLLDLIHPDEIGGYLTKVLSQSEDLCLSTSGQVCSLLCRLLVSEVVCGHSNHLRSQSNLQGEGQSPGQGRATQFLLSGGNLSTLLLNLIRLLVREATESQTEGQEPFKDEASLARMTTLFRCLSLLPSPGTASQEDQRKADADLSPCVLSLKTVSTSERTDTAAMRQIVLREATRALEKHSDWLLESSRLASSVVQPIKVHPAAHSASAENLQKELDQLREAVRILAANLKNKEEKETSLRSELAEARSQAKEYKDFWQTEVKKGEALAAENERLKIALENENRAAHADTAVDERQQGSQESYSEISKCQFQLSGHSQQVNAICFSPDGRMMASGSDDKSIIIWSPSSWAIQRQLKGHSGAVLAVAFSCKGFLASGAGDSSVRIWSPAAGTLVTELRGHTGTVLSVCFSPDGASLASGSADCSIRIWCPFSKAPQREIRGHSSAVRSVSYSPDGASLAWASRDGSIRLWSLSSGDCLREFKGRADSVCAVSFSPDGRSLASGSSDSSICLWDAASRACRREMMGLKCTVWAVGFSPDGRSLASGSDDGSVRIWSCSSGTCLRELKGHASAVNAVAVSPDGAVIASGSADKGIRIWSS